MQLGYSITSRHPAAAPAREVGERLLERAHVAREAGFDYVQAGDDHASPGNQYLQNAPTAGRLAGEFDRVAPLFLLPLYHPVLVAEQVGTLAAFAEEVDLWCAIGYRQAAFDAFAVDRSERVGRFEESLSIVRRLWREDGVTAEGEFYALEDVSVDPKVDPRVCVGASAEPAVRRAGRLGDAWVTLPSEPAAAIERKRRWLREAGGGTVIARRDALVLEDGDRAERLARERLASGYRGWPAEADWVLAGGPEAVRAEFDRLAEIGVDEVAVRPMVGEHAAETLRVIGEVNRRREGG